MQSSRHTSKFSMLLTNGDLSISQAIVDDPELSPEPKLTLIVEKKIPGELIPIAENRRRSQSFSLLAARIDVVNICTYKLANNMTCQA